MGDRTGVMERRIEIMGLLRKKGMITPGMITPEMKQNLPKISPKGNHMLLNHLEGKNLQEFSAMQNKKRIKTLLSKHGGRKKKKRRKTRRKKTKRKTKKTKRRHRHKTRRRKTRGGDPGHLF